VQRRAFFSLVNICVAAAAIVVLFAFPQYASYAIYGFLGWFVVSLSMVWFARGSPQTATPSPGAPLSSPGVPSAPLPSTGRIPARAPTAPAPIAFCIYCALDLPPGADRCPSCGHAVRRFS
jgi:hypothetical protein